MKLNKHYKDKLVLVDDKYLQGGFCWINNDIRGQLLKDVNILEYNILYPFIIIGLYDAGFIDVSEKDNIDRIRYFNNNRDMIKRDPSKYIDERTFSNRYYGKLVQKYPKQSELVTQYMRHFWNDILEDNKDNIYYIDTHMVFYKGDLNITHDLGIPYTIKNIQYLYMEAKKRYTYLQDNRIVTKGYYTTKHPQGNPRYNGIAQQIENLIKQENRQDKLTQIGI